VLVMIDTNRANRITATEKIGILYAKMTEIPYPDDLPESFLASFHFPGQNFSKTLPLTQDTQVHQAIANTLKNTHSTLFPEGDADKFLLKICGANLVCHVTHALIRSASVC
jgi:hypothetical protein